MTIRVYKLFIKMLKKLHVSICVLCLIKVTPLTLRDEARGMIKMTTMMMMKNKENMDEENSIRIKQTDALIEYILLYRLLFIILKLFLPQVTFLLRDGE